MEVLSHKQRKAELRRKEKETLRIKRCRKFHPFSVLGLDPSELEEKSLSARAELITSKYRELARVIHPDRNTHPDAEEAFSTLCDSYNMLLDHKIQKRLITAEVGVRNSVENSLKSKKAKSEVLIESMVEEKLEIALLNIFADYQKTKEVVTRERPKQEESVIILMPPVISVPNNCNDSVKNGGGEEPVEAISVENSCAGYRVDENLAVASETILVQPAANMTKDNSHSSLDASEPLQNRELKHCDGLESQSSGDDGESLEFLDESENQDLGENGAEDNSCTALSMQLNASETEIVAYYTGDLDSLYQPTVLNSFSLKGAEGHSKNKMAHKKDRHEAGVAARARQRQAAEKRMAKKGFAFTGKVRFAQNVDEQTDAL